jgi:Hemerythrin HHE cation binding domain
MHLEARRRTPMDAIELLERDHKNVKKLLEEIDETEANAVEKRRELFERIRHEMQVHEKIEEQIFYPALKDHPRAKDIVLEGYEEHHAVDVLLDELDDVPFDDERWAPKMTVIKENIEHHIEEEEEEMFEKARSILDDSDLARLGEQMEQLKKKES